MINRVFQKATLAFELIFLPNEKNNYRSKILDGRFLLFLAAFLIILKLLILPIFYTLDKSIFYATINKNVLLTMINEERVKNSLPPLEENKILSRAAELKAGDMLAKDYFGQKNRIQLHL